MKTVLISMTICQAVFLFGPVGAVADEPNESSKCYTGAAFAKWMCSHFLGKTRVPPSHVADFCNSGSVVLYDLCEVYSTEMRQRNSESVHNNYTIPTDQTQVVEYQSRVCFSMKPIKRCQDGTVTNGRESNLTKIEYFCVHRQYSLARTFKQDVHDGRVVNSTGFQPSYVDEIRQPIDCTRVYLW